MFNADDTNTMQIFISLSSTGYSADISNLTHYLTGSLKETTFNKRTIKTAPVHYHANDNINKGHALPK